jgi:uncharacterized protein YqjF (DUF2071 family)
MQHRWEDVAFLHMPVSPAVVAGTLPEGLEVDEWDGSAWLGLVLFRMRLGGPAGPRPLVFPETNVRTYVVGPDGRPGVWFYSLDAGSLAAVLGARASWQLPYFWSHMSVDRADGTVRYRATRRRPGPRGAGHDVSVRPGAALARATDFDNFLTARFTLWNVVAGRLSCTTADHDPWPLHEAQVTAWREDLAAAAGLPSLAEPLVTHWSPGVDVRIGVPRLVSR